MNVLELVTDAASQLGAPAPSSLITSGTVETQWKYLLYGVSRELRSSRAFPQQKRAFSITLSSGRSKYALPIDFYSGLLGTQFDQTNNWELVGPISDRNWNYILYGPGTGLNRKMYRIFGHDKNAGAYTSSGQLQIYPTPTATETISFDYISATTILPTPWVASTAFGANSWCTSFGNIYQTLTAGGTTGTTAPTSDTSEFDGGITWTRIYTARETIVANTDLSIFDDDVMIEGLKYKWKASKNMDYSLEKMLFEKMMDTARSRWVGNYIGRMDRGVGSNISAYTVATGGWTF